MAISFCRLISLLVMLASGLPESRFVLFAARTGELANSRPSIFKGSKGAEQREVNAIQLCWCPPGKFMMGSPKSEPERRPDEEQVEVTLTKGFWMAKYETTQGQWKRILRELPGELTAELLRFGKVYVTNRQIVPGSRVGIRMPGWDNHGNLVWRQP